MARVTAEEAARTREKLLDAALEVFWEQGVARPSLTRVAERAGMTRGAVYGHFENKTSLFEALCDRYLLPAAVLEQLREDGADDPLGTLVTWFQQVIRRARYDPERRKLFEILFVKCEAVEGDPVRDRLQRDSERARHHEQALLAQAVAQGQLPADLDLELAAVVVHTFLGGQLRFLALVPGYDPQPVIRCADTLLRELLDGCALRCGEPGGDGAVADE